MLEGLYLIAFSFRKMVRCVNRYSTRLLGRHISISLSTLPDHWTPSPYSPLTNIICKSILFLIVDALKLTLISERAGPKTTGMKNLITRLKGRGVPVDQIGVQGHLSVGTVPNDLNATLSSYTALGVSIAYVSSLDFRIALNMAQYHRIGYPHATSCYCCKASATGL
jgi:hypothetical protein